MAKLVHKHGDTEKKQRQKHRIKNCPDVKKGIRHEKAFLP
jgi:hypothetical protein